MGLSSGRVTNYETATFAGGCFWCFEEIFRRVKGVVEVVSGYSGGNLEHPGYEDVSMGTSGHAEAVQITFDPSIISYEKLLEIFWHLHDPTTKNRQGYDVGTEYRSIIFYHNDKQKAEIEKSLAALKKSNIYKDEIVTEIVPYKEFYKAEDHHQKFYQKNFSHPYCAIIIDPKLDKLKDLFKEQVKES